MVLGALGGERLGRPVVGDGGGHDHDVGVLAAGEGLGLELGGGGRLDELHARRRGDGEVRAEQRDTGPAPAGLGGEGDAHASGRAVADEADGVDRLPCAAGGDEEPLAGERAGAGEDLLGRAHDLVGLGHAPDAELALRGLPLVRADEDDASRSEGLGVRARRRVRPHPRVHRRGDEDGPTVGQRRLRQDVVRQAVRELRQRVRGARRHEQQVGPGEMEVDVVAGRPPREGAEGLGRDEALGPGREQRDDVVARLDEEPRDLAGLVGGDAARDAQQHACHGRIMPGHGRRGHPAAGSSTGPIPSSATRYLA